MTSRVNAEVEVSPNGRRTQGSRKIIPAREPQSQHVAGTFPNQRLVGEDIEVLRDEVSRSHDGIIYRAVVRRLYGNGPGR